MKISNPIISIFCALALCACGEKKDYETSGVFEATEVVVSAEASGKILKLDAEEGTLLKKGEVVGLIDSVQLELAREKALADIAALESRLPDIPVQLAPLRERLAKQKFEEARFKKLVASDSANKKQLQDIESEIEVVSRQIDAARSELEKTSANIAESVKALKIQVKIFEDQISKSKIVNPIGGTVLVKYAEAGEFAAVGRGLYKIADVSSLYLRAYFTDAQLTKLKLGQKLKLRADFGRDGSRAYEGEITWIADKAEYTPKGVRNRDERADLVYAVKILVKNDGYLKIGQYAEVETFE
jgi:HlyD family secretion protein